jgi:hypothetical protein
MLVFGGVGLGAIYGDLCSLRVADPQAEGAMVWEKVTALGDGPEAR